MLFLLLIRPLQKKQHNLANHYAALIDRKNRPTHVLAPYTNSVQNIQNNQTVENTQHFSSTHQCALFFIGACTRHHLICHEVKTQSALTKQHNNKCFVNANINGSFAGLNQLLKQLKENKAIKINTLAMKNTPHGIQAQCRLRFLLLSEWQSV